MLDREKIKVEFIEYINSIKVQKMKDSFNIYESFDSHYEITKIYRNDVVNVMFYEFSVRTNKYRIFIELYKDNIHVGFEKEDDFFKNTWYIEGIDDDLKNGEIQKLFGTVIYVIKDLYKEKYNNIQIQTNEAKKFRVYLRIVQQMSKTLLSNSIISHNDKFIFITNINNQDLNILDIIKSFKYKPKKKD